MPEQLCARAVEAIPKIVVLPSNNEDIQGASFNLTRAVVIFEDPKQDYTEEILTVLHEIGHILDPGWQDVALLDAMIQERKRCARSTRRMLDRVGVNAFEGFAELAAWEMAGVKQRSSFPLSSKIVHEALYWENN